MLKREARRGCSGCRTSTVVRSTRKGERLDAEKAGGEREDG